MLDDSLSNFVNFSLYCSKIFSPVSLTSSLIVLSNSAVSSAIASELIFVKNVTNCFAIFLSSITSPNPSKTLLVFPAAWACRISALFFMDSIGSSFSIFCLNFSASFPSAIFAFTEAALSAQALAAFSSVATCVFAFVITWVLSITSWNVSTRSFTFLVLAYFLT